MAWGCGIDLSIGRGEIITGHTIIGTTKTWKNISRHGEFLAHDMAQFHPKDNKFTSTWYTTKDNWQWSCKFATVFVSNDIYQKHKNITWYRPGPRINIKMSSYLYRKSHCEEKTILRLSNLHNGISYTVKTTSLYQIGAQYLFQFSGHTFFKSLWNKLSDASNTLLCQCPWSWYHLRYFWYNHSWTNLQDCETGYIACRTFESMLI